MNLRTAARLAGLVLALGTLGCGDDGYEITDLSNRLEVSPAFYGVDEGLPPIQYEATVGGTPATVTWASSDPAVATVNASGLVTPVSDGFAAITATLSSDPSKKKSSSLTVNALFGTALTSGVQVTGISGAIGDQNLLYRIYVPAGSTNLNVTMAGGTGDFDVYVAPGPNIASYDNWVCRPYAGGNNEVCNIANPQAGTWYIWIDVYDAGSGVTLRATVTP